MPVTYKDLPGPPGLPILGNLHQVRFSKLHAYFEKQGAVYGDVFKVKLGPERLTIISRPELIQQILKSRPTHFRRVSKLDAVLRTEGIHGVFNAEGDDWKLHRRIVTRGLDIKHLRQFFPAMELITERLLSKMTTISDQDQTYPIQADLLRYTVDVTTSLAFGIDMNTLEQKNGVIQHHMEKIFPMIFRRINSPFAWHKIYQTKKDKEFSHALREIEKQVTGFIVTGKERLLQNPQLREQPSNILEALLVAADEETGITHREIRGNLLTLLMAGEDTTAHSLAWCIWLICQHPHIQQKLQVEADNVLGEQSCLQEYIQHEELTYTSVVIHETMRLKSVAPVMLVEPIEDIVMDGNQFVKGSKIVLLTRAGGLNESYFSNSGVMDPDRWLKEISRCPVHSPDAFLPFGSGPRLCPGKNLALLEMKLVLSMMAKNFTMELLTNPEDVEENMAFTMMPGRFEIRLKRRNVI